VRRLVGIVMLWLPRRIVMLRGLRGLRWLRPVRFLRLCRLRRLRRLRRRLPLPWRRLLLPMWLHRRCRLDVSDRRVGPFRRLLCRRAGRDEDHVGSDRLGGRRDRICPAMRWVQRPRRADGGAGIRRRQQHDAVHDRRRRGVHQRPCADSGQDSNARRQQPGDHSSPRRLPHVSDGSTG